MFNTPLLTLSAMTQLLNFGILGRVCHWPSLDLVNGDGWSKLNNSILAIWNSGGWKGRFWKDVPHWGYKGHSCPLDLGFFFAVCVSVESICTTIFAGERFQLTATIGVGALRLQRQLFRSRACCAFPLFQPLTSLSCSILITEEMSWWRRRSWCHHNIKQCDVKQHTHWNPTHKLWVS